MIVLSIFIMLCITFLSGIVMQKLFNQRYSFTNAVMMGFLALLASFHIIAYPMIRLNASFSLLFWIYTVILLLVIISAFYILSQKETRIACFQNIQGLSMHIRSEFPLLLMTVGFAACFLFISLGYSYVTSDDSYYLPRAMEMLAQNQLGFSEGLGWSGLSETSFPETVDASTLEAWKAYWSYLFGLHPTVFSRNTLTVVVHFVSWCSLYQAYQSVSRHKGTGLSACAFLLIYMVLTLVDNHIAGTAPFWSLRYPAQGKSMLISIIHPALIYGCAQIVNCGKNPIPWQKWAVLALIFTAGVATTIIGVFWPFLCCLTMGIPYLLIERRKDLHKLLLPLILVSLPIILYAGISYLTIATEQTRYFQIASPSWSESLVAGLNVNRLDLFLVCLVFVLIFGSKTAKLVVAGGCITLLATFVNPLFIGFVSKYLTTGSVYFRLFWMVPIYFLAAYTVAELFGSCTLKTRQISALLIAAILVLGVGIGILQLGPRELYHRVNENVNLNLGNERRTNPYGLPDFWYRTGSRLLENTGKDERIRVMWLSEADCHLRQYSERIELVGACRSTQWVYFDQPLEEGTVAPLLLWEDFMQNNKQDFSDPVWTHAQLVASQIDYICVADSSDFANREIVPSGFELFSKDNGIIIYRVLN